jgi:type IV pilus assembly protein PilE
MASQIAQERYRAYNNEYASTAVILDAAGLGITESDKYYNYTISSTTSSTYELAATPKAGSTQNNDTGCYPLTVDQSNDKAPASCWKR